MTFEWSEWGPPLAVIAVALLGGIIWLSRLQATEAYASTVNQRGNRDDLEFGKQAVLDALRQLEHEREKMSEEDYNNERQTLIQRGSRYLKELEETSLPSSEQHTELLTQLRALRDQFGSESFSSALTEMEALPNAPTPRMSGEWKGAISTLLAVGLAMLMVNMAADQSRPRVGDEPMTGTSATAPQAPSMRASLEAKLAASPQNIELLNQLTQLSLGENDLAAAQGYNQRALEAEPSDRDARMYRAVLAGLVGMYDRSLSYLDELLLEDPDFAAALSYKGIIAVEAGKPEVAIPALERAMALQGNHPALEAALQRARSGKAVGPASTQAPQGPPHSQAEPVSSGRPVASGTISLSTGVTLPDGGTLFIAVRDPAGGPPLAALKRPATFPQDFEITEGDAIQMGGQPRQFPQEVKLVIRVDTDGNAMTKEAGAPAMETLVTLGTKGLQIALQ